MANRIDLAELSAPGVDGVVDRLRRLVSAAEEFDESPDEETLNNLLDQALAIAQLKPLPSLEALVRRLVVPSMTNRAALRSEQ